MLRHKMGALPTERQEPKQAARLARVGMTGVLALSLAGCSTVQNLVHRTEGGEIAKPRPTPPGLNQPFPNLATVPPRPAAPDQKALEAISQSLIADRNNAQHQLLPPPADPSSPSASPALFGVGTVPPPPPPGSPSATLAAVQAPPATPASPQAGPAPTTPPAARPASPPAPIPPRSVASAPLGPAINPTGPANVQVPPGPPAPPRLASMAPPAGAPQGAAPPVPAAPTAATPAPPAPPPARTAAAPAPPADPATTVAVEFPPASAVLPAASATALRGLAQRRGNHVIAVVGHGDTESTDPAVQSQAVALGLQRAQAIAQALAADGVPQAAVRLDASANGRGGSARLIE